MTAGQLRHPGRHLGGNPDFYKSFFRILLAVALQNVIAYSVNVADNLMLGRYSQDALSAAAAVNQIQFMLQQTVSGGFVGGLTALCAQYWGKGDLRSVRRLTAVCLRWGLILGICVFLICALFPGQLLHLFTSDASIISAGTKYLDLLKYTYLLYIFSTILMGALRSVGTVNISLFVSAVSLVLNVGINYTLIFGNFGAPAMGIRGAAIGTLCARSTEFLLVIGYILFADQKLKLFSENPFCRDRKLSRDYRSMAVVTTANSVLWSLATPIQTGILGRLSADAIAANSVATTMFQYMKVVVLGEASASSVSVGKLIGSGVNTKERIRPYCRTLQLLYLFIAVTLACVLLLLRGPLLRFYSLTPEALRLTGQLIALMALIFVGMAYQMPISSGIMMGGGDAKYCTRVNLLSTWLVVMPLGFAAAFWWKLPVFWVVFFLNSDQLFKCLPHGVRVNRYQWIHILTKDN